MRFHLWVGWHVKTVSASFLYLILAPRNPEEKCCFCTSWVHFSLVWYMHGENSFRGVTVSDPALDWSLLLHIARKGIKKKDGSELKLLTWKLILWAAICFLVTLLRSSELRGISGSWDSYNQVQGLKILGCLNRYFEGYSQTAWMITFLSLWTVDVEVCLKKQPCSSSGILLSQIMSLWNGDGHPQSRVWFSFSGLPCLDVKQTWVSHLPVFLLLQDLIMILEGKGRTYLSYCPFIFII